MNSVTGIENSRSRSIARRIKDLVRRAIVFVSRAWHSGDDRDVRQALVRAEIRDLQSAIRDVQTEINAQFSFLAHDLDARLESQNQGERLDQLHDQLRHLESSVGSRFNALDTRVFETMNRVVHVDTGVHSRLNQLEFIILPGMLQQTHEAAAMLLSLEDGEPRHVANASRPVQVGYGGLDQAVEAARRDFPAVFEAWRVRLAEMQAAFDQTKAGNAANPADIYSLLFRAFVNRHVGGCVLDVGCGPFGKPYYLLDYPSRMIIGLEPLGQRGPSDIEIVEGISEYLPWPDQSFNTVISATSLDHCLSLQKSLSEIVRVLAPDGRLLLWIGSNPGSPPYQPDAPGFVPADKFHLFHFDVEWFEPMIHTQFEIEARIKLDRASYSHVFYSLIPRPRTR
jgi:SAM-dependent methyltransferase